MILNSCRLLSDPSYVSAEQEEQKRAEQEEKARRAEETRKQQAEEAKQRAKQEKERERKAAAAAAAAKASQLDQFRKMQAERLEADRKKLELGRGSLSI